MTARRMLGGGLLVGLVALMAGCAVPAPRLSATPGSSTPLRASIFPPYYGQVPVAVNKPAYVALFEVVPGLGASMIYPKSGSGYTQVRDSWIPLDYSAQRWLYASNHMGGPAAGQWSGFDYGYGLGYGLSSRSVQGAGVPRYLFLIASETPIATDRFQHNVGAVRQYLGNSLYSSYQPYNVMEQLAYAMAPYDATEDSWVTDVFVDWGYDWGYGYVPGTAAQAASWQPILCSDGTVGYGRWVPGWGYDAFSCMPMQRQEAQPGQPGATPSDSSGRSRIRSAVAAADGRDRIRPAPNGREVAPQSAEEVRSRITQLRDDASRSQFGSELNDRVRREVALRHRADNLMGVGGGRGTADRSYSGGANSSARAATRSREAAARDGRAEANAERAAARAERERAPRSRETRPAPTPQTRSQPQSSPGASSAPRSRQPATPPPSGSSTRSRPDA